MRFLASFVLSLMLAACASSQYAERQSPVPPGQGARSQTLPIQQQQLLRTGPADSEATRQWLDQEIERNRYVPPPPPPPPVVTQRVVVRREYVPVRRYHYHDEVWDDGYYVRSPQASSPTFPWHTAVGAGLGAVIGHQYGHRSRGAWIGAGTGLLFDLHRW